MGKQKSWLSGRFEDEGVDEERGDEAGCDEEEERGRESWEFVARQVVASLGLVEHTWAPSG